MKKIICVIAALLLIFTASSAIAAGLSDEQFSELKDYGIFEGDANGNLRLEDTVTRAEAVKMICSAMCMKEMDDGVLPFPDIMSGYWAAGWITTAKTLGIVSGDENGNFRPGDSVTNEEYIKMLVTALGYFPLAEQRGGFPAGYIAVANTYGITAGMQFGVGEASLRGDVALMTYRAIDVPMMFQTGFGSVVEYVVMDGKNGQELKTLRKDLDPDYIYPDTEKDDDSKVNDGNLDLTDSIYNYLDVRVGALEVRGAAYRFIDQNRGSDSPTYVVDSSTYVYMGDDTLPLSELKDGMTVRILCTDKDSSGISTILGIEIYENRINSKIISQNK